MRGIIQSLAFPVVVAVLGSSGCSSSDSASCPSYTELCTAVPLAAITTACGTDAVSVVPMTYSDSSQDVNSCDFEGPNGGTDVAVKTWTGCFKTGASDADLFYTSTHDDPGVTGTTKHDVSGLGDKAFYKENLTDGDATLFVLNGAVLLYVADNQITGPADSALPCLTEIANQILAIN
jgi:hypothetical protein